MNSLVIVGIMALNLFFAIAVFVLLARPKQMIGLMAGLSGFARRWREGRVSAEDESDILQAAEGWGRVALLLLFLSSFLSGTLIAYLQLSGPLLVLH
jgi:hypothetical protein